MSRFFTSWSETFGNFDGGSEELVNMLTHAIAVGLSLAGLIALIATASLYGTTAGLIGGIIFGVSLIAAYSASTLLHMPWIKPLKLKFLGLDQSMIFFLIAGTYTPVLLVAFSGFWAAALLILVWGMAAAGVSLRLTYLEASSHWLTGLYLGLGWFGLVIAHNLVAALGWTYVIWILAGGIVYSAGVIFYLWRSLVFNHAIWHGFVMSASAIHFGAILSLIAR